VNLSRIQQVTKSRHTIGLTKYCQLRYASDGGYFS
jgi:hypothetical protein